MENLDVPSGPSAHCASRRAGVRVRGRAPRVRAGRVGRPRAARRGAAPAAGRARSRAGHPAQLRHRPARGHARPRDRALARRPPPKLDAPVLAALRLGVFQLTFLDRVPAHAAVGESVELAKRDAPRGAGLVNAVLRRAAREARALVAALPDATPRQAALAHSHPEWIAQLWWDTFGAETARALMAADNEPAEPSLRANTLKTTAASSPSACPSRHGVDGEALILDGPFDIFAAPEWRDGLLMPQSRAAMAVARALAPAPGRARARPVRRPRRQDHPPRRADGQRGRDRRRREAPGPRRRAAPHRARAWARRSSTCAPRTPPSAGARRLRPRPRRPALLRPRHARLAPRRALAQGRPPAGAGRAAGARSSRPERRR